MTSEPATDAGGPAAILDTGPLVAYLDAGDAHHAWAREALTHVRAPLATCEAVIAESLHLLRRTPRAQDRVLEWIARGVITIEFSLISEGQIVRRLMRRYADVPMSFADACVVRMSELLERHTVCTLDGGFHVYRRHGASTIPLIIPTR